MPKTQTQIKEELESLLKKATEDDPKKLAMIRKKVEELESAIKSAHLSQRKSNLVSAN
jgi:endonuclease III